MKRMITPILALLCLFGGILGAGAQDFIVNNGTEPQSFDPSLIQGVPEHRIYLALFEGLVVNDPKTSKAIPGVAESWVVSSDGLTITFKLRKCKWSDGTPITALDFVDGWLRTLDPATASEYAYMIGTVVKGADEYNKGKGPREGVGIKAVTAQTFEVKLKGPAAYAVDMMSHYAFAPLPMHALAKYGDDWIRPGKFVGNGPFTLKEWKPQEYVLVEKNAKYWDAKSVKLKTIKFLPIEDNRTAYNMFKNGEIDWVTTVPNDLIDEIKLRKDYQVGPQFSTYYILYNVTRKPLDDVRVRKALAMAIDKQGLVERITKGGQLVADTVIPPNSGYIAPKGAGYNPEEARKLLAAAGFPDGKGFPAMTVIYNTSDNHKRIMEYVQAEWKKNLGIEFALKNLEWTTFLDTRSNTHDFDITRAGWIADYVDPSTFLDMFLTGGGNNDGLYTNAKYDELCAKAVTMKAGAERLKVMAQAEEIFITQDQGMIPIYFYVAQDLIDTAKWGGWYNNPLGSHPWKFIAKK